MKETEIELTEKMTAELGYDKTADIREVSEMIRCDMLRYARTLNAEEEIDEN